MNKIGVNKHFNKRFLISSAAMLTLISSAALAASQEVDSITKLLSTGDAKAAYSQAKLYQGQMEGEPEFDYVFGIAAVNSGHLSEGVLAFERVVSAQPDNVRARFELAKAYYIIGDNVRARREFERLSALTTSEKDKQAIQGYLTAIRQRESRYETTAKGYVQLGAGYDTNINSAPSGDLADNLLPIHLGAGATDKPDAFAEFAAGAQIEHPVTRRVGLYGELNGRWRGHRDENSYDNSLLAGQMGIKWSYKNNLVKASALLQQYTVDNNVYRNMGGATVEALHSYSAQSTVGVALSYMDLTYPDQPLRDSDQFTLGVNYAHRWLGRGEPSGYVGAFGGNERAKGEGDNARSVADRSLYGLQLGGDYKLSDKLGARLTLLGQQSTYTAPFLALPSLPKRDDTFISSELSLIWLVAQQWKVTASYTYSENSSNIDMYNYTRNQYGVTLRRDF